MIDPSIIEAAARARAALEEMARQKLLEEMDFAAINYSDFAGGYDELVRRSREVLAALPLIEAAALEKAAKVAEDRDPFGPSPIAAAIRALKEERKGTPTRETWVTYEEYEVEYQKWLAEPIEVSLTREELQCLFIASKVRLSRPNAFRPKAIESGIEKLAEAYQSKLKTNLAAAAWRARADGEFEVAEELARVSDAVKVKPERHPEDKR